MCKQIIQEGLCQFGEKCAYSHNRRSNLQGLGKNQELNAIFKKTKQKKLKNILTKIMTEIVKAG